MTYQIYLEICKKKLLVSIEADSAPLAIKQIKDSIYFYKIVKIEEPSEEVKSFDWGNEFDNLLNMFGRMK